MSENKLSLTPQLSWYQNSTYVYIDILLSDSKNSIVDYEQKEDKCVFLYEGDMGDKHYVICFDLYDNIVESMSSFKVMDTKISCKIKKEKEDEEWPRLTNKKDIYKSSIKTNWDKMDYEEEEIDDDIPNGYESMMPGMPNMQDMISGMSGMNNFDMESMMNMMRGNGMLGGEDMDDEFDEEEGEEEEGMEDLLEEDNGEDADEANTEE